MPGLPALAIMGNVDNRSIMLEMEEVEAAARTLGLAVVKAEIRQARDIAPAFETLAGSAQALYVASDPVLTTNRVRVVTLALVGRLPTVFGFPRIVDAGGLMCYGCELPGPVPARRRPYR